MRFILILGFFLLIYNIFLTRDVRGLESRKASQNRLLDFKVILEVYDFLNLCLFFKFFPILNLVFFLSFLRALVFLSNARNTYFRQKCEPSQKWLFARGFSKFVVPLCPAQSPYMRSTTDLRKVKWATIIKELIRHESFDCTGLIIITQILINIY